MEDEPDENSAKLIHNLYYAALIHSGFLVKDPQYFSQSVFSLINTAFQVKDEISEIEVTEEDIESMEPAPEPVEADPSMNADDTIDLDADNIQEDDVIPDSIDPIPVDTESLEL